MLEAIIKNSPPIVGVPFLSLCVSTYFNIGCPALSFLNLGIKKPYNDKDTVDNLIRKRK